MSSPVATSTPIEATNVMRSELKRLRRQNAVPLDLGVTKKSKHDNITEVPPTPSDEETQLLWPSPVRSSPTPPPTVSPLQQGVDEAGCKPLKNESEVIVVLDSDEEAELEALATNAREQHINAPKVQNKHVKRRSLSRPRKLFREDKTVIVDEVQETESRKQLVRLAELVICSELWRAINKYCGDECYGCSVDHPSQIQHDWCIMASDEERLDMFLDSALKDFDYAAVFENNFIVKCFHEMELRIPRNEAFSAYNDVHEGVCKDSKHLRRIMLLVSNVDHEETFLQK